MMFINATLALTLRCNLRCYFCLIPHDQKKGDMSEDVLDSVKRFIKEAEISYVILSGGEPLLYPKLTEVVRYFRKDLLQVTVFSNLTLRMSEEFASLLARSGTFLKFSVYATNFKDFKRVTGGSEREWDNFLRNLGVVLDEGIYGYAMFIGLKENSYFEGELPEPFSRLLDRIRIGYSDTLRPNWYGEGGGERGRVPRFARSDPLPLNHITKMPPPSRNCILSYYPRIFVTPEGLVYPCPYAAEVYGHISKLPPNIVLKKSGLKLPWEGGRCNILWSPISNEDDS